jgi:hypothetical protein
LCAGLFYEADAAKTVCGFGLEDLVQNRFAGFLWEVLASAKIVILWRERCAFLLSVRFNSVIIRDG